MSLCDIDISPMYDVHDQMSVLFVGRDETDLFQILLSSEEAAVLGKLLLLASERTTDGTCFGMRTVVVGEDGCAPELKAVLKRIAPT